MLYLRQSTASQEVLLGPFVDDTDGKTAETGLTIANTDIKLWFEGGTSESSKNSGGATHIASGRYYAVLDATDTATVGKLEINVAVSGALPVRREFMVLEEAIYDALFASSATGAFTGVALAADQAVNATKFGGTTVTGRDIGASVLLSSGTGTGQISLSSGQVTFGNTSIATVTNLTNLPSIPAGWLTASGIAASALNGKGDWNIGKTGYTVSTVSDKTGYSLSGTQTFNVTGNITGNLTGSVGSVTGAVGSVTGNVGGNVAGSVGSVTGAVGSVTGLTASDVGAIKTKTDFLPSATAGAAGGLFIAGSNAATTVASLTVTTDFAIGNAFSMTSFSLDGTAPLPSSTAGSPSGLAIVGSKVDLVDAPNATAITAIQSGLSTLTASQVWASGARTLTAQADAVLATSQPNYAPAKAGDAMTLTSAYDAAKTALTTLGTNAPANWINAAAIAASALNGKGDWNIGKTGYTLTQTFPTNFSALSINASGHIARVVLTDTLTTYTGNTVQTGDSYARLGVPAGASIAADIAGISAGSAPTVEEIDTQLSGTHGNGLWGGAAGSGAFTITQNVKTSLGANMQNVDVTMFDGTNYYSAKTNASGNAVFNLNAATYTQSAYYPGYTITNNGSVVVTANATLTGIVGTANSVAPPAGPTDCSVYFVAIHDGALYTNQTINFFQTAAPSGNGNVYISENRTATSDATTALVTIDLPQGSTWKCVSPLSGAQFTITVPAATTYEVPNVNF